MSENAKVISLPGEIVWIVLVDQGVLIDKEARLFLFKAVTAPLSEEGVVVDFLYFTKAMEPSELATLMVKEDCRPLPLKGILNLVDQAVAGALKSMSEEQSEAFYLNPMVIPEGAQIIAFLDPHSQGTQPNVLTLQRLPSGKLWMLLYDSQIVARWGKGLMVPIVRN